jgi:hypothetical protein
MASATKPVRTSKPPDDTERLRAVWDLVARRAKDPTACLVLVILTLEGGEARTTHLRQAYGLSQYVLDTVGRQLKFAGEITYDGNELKLLA